eukprot:Filipodium_phascolosomae@DN1213_c0_g1_i1.p1
MEAQDTDETYPTPFSASCDYADNITSNSASCPPRSEDHTTKNNTKRTIPHLNLESVKPVDLLIEAAQASAVLASEPNTRVLLQTETTLCAKSTSSDRQAESKSFGRPAEQDDIEWLYCGANTPSVLRKVPTEGTSVSDGTSCRSLSDLLHSSVFWVRSVDSDALTTTTGVSTKTADGKNQDEDLKTRSTASSDNCPDIPWSRQSPQVAIHKLRTEVDKWTQESWRLHNQVEELLKFNSELQQRVQVEQTLRRLYYNELIDIRGSIRVICRLRPGNNPGSDALKNEEISQDALTVAGPQTILAQDSGADVSSVQRYKFDYCFPATAGQAEVYDEVKGLIQSVLDGYNVSIFAYGQTGSGKTYTIHGGSGGDDLSDGIAPRAIRDLFSYLSYFESSKQGTCQVSASFCELYNDNLIDVLKPSSSKSKSLEISRRGPSGMVTVEGLSSRTVKTVDGMMKLLALVRKRRRTCATAFHNASSRSHLIASLLVQIQDNSGGNGTIGKLSFIDLAGSERASAAAPPERFSESRCINLALSALSDVIAGLLQGHAHIPYRNNKLTELMQDSIGGAAKTLMFVNVNPAPAVLLESKRSLGWAEMVRQIRIRSSSKQRCRHSKGFGRAYDKVTKIIPTKMQSKTATASHTPPLLRERLTELVKLLQNRGLSVSDLKLHLPEYVLSNTDTVVSATSSSGSINSFTGHSSTTVSNLLSDVEAFADADEVNNASSPRPIKQTV